MGGLAHAAVGREAAARQIPRGGGQPATGSVRGLAVGSVRGWGSKEEAAAHTCQCPLLPLPSPMPAAASVAGIEEERSGFC
uniref:Uncharacterized protein n=1 Tax=Oryza meridionalis TaxID=40149 RepID=A0A0E0DA31_9ORYZ